MAKTSKVTEFLKKKFDIKTIIWKSIIALCAMLLVLAFSLSFYFWLKDKPDGVVGKANGFWYISIIWNEGIGFSKLDGQHAAIYTIQSLMFVLLLAIYLFVCDSKITASFIALAMFGGLFNLIQRACATGQHANMVLDYFQFGFWESFATFNWPDMFVVIGIFGFVISYIVLVVIDSKHEDATKKKAEKPVEQPTPITSDK